MFKLTIEDDEGKTTVVPLARDEMTIGRLEGNAIRLTERNVSRRHARLSRQNGAIFIEDLASFTGVRINGVKITSPTPLREGDEVQIGDYKIVLRGERPPADERATQPSMPAAMVPMATVGGAVAIPTRASVAALAAQPASAANGQTTAVIPVASDQAPVRSRTKTSPPKPFQADVEEGVPEAQVEGQPTIPMRAIGEEIAGLPSAGPPARLFVLTTDLAGSEVPLNKASLVIGRTDENDVVLNHRSISRHHAKIVRDGDRYTIVDLQSANGVRVNGEDYERIELNPGDVIELGHVKLRFVGPLEQFLFDPFAAGSPPRLPLRWLAIGVGGAAALGVALLLLRHGAHEEAPPPVQVAAPSVPAPEPAHAPPAPPTPASILAVVKRAVAGEDWEAARSALDSLPPGTDDPEAREELAAVRRTVDTERQGAALFAKFDEAASAKSYADALVAFDRISPESLYKRRARQRYEEARTLLVAEHLATAEKARSAGRCGDVRSEADAVLNIDPKNTVVRDLVKLCRAQATPTAAPRPAPAPRLARARGNEPGAAERSAALARRNEPARAEAPARRGDLARNEAPRRADPVEAPSAPEPEDADALMKQAREAWLRQQCGSAMELSRKALRAKPGLTDAYQILAVCSCSLKDAEAAGRAYARLDDKNRSLVHALCLKNGVTVGE